MDQSFNERQRLVQAAIQAARGSTDCYVVELFDDRAIYECYGDGSDAGKSFEVPYSLAADETVTLGDRTEVQRETTYVAVKFLKGSDVEIEGLAIPFGGPKGGKDLQGESFDASTDFAFDWFPQGRPLIFEHGLDSAMKTIVSGRQTDHEVRDDGVWARGVLDRSAKYHSALAKLVKAGKLFFSSGTMPHLVETDGAGNIKRWPWVESSFTPTPANPYAAVGIKSVDLLDHLAAASIDVPAALIAAALKSLDELPEDDDGPLAGLKFAEHADRLLADVEAFRTRTGSLVGIRAKAGRVLSATTRERLSRHPGSLRELADNLDSLLSDAAADPGKSLDLGALALDTERTLARLNGVVITPAE